MAVVQALVERSLWLCVSIQVSYLPPEAILIRRMHGIVAVVLAQLRAGADWGAIAAEYLHGEPHSTPLGDAEAAFFTRRDRTTSATLAAAD
jgi:hypothetical protein